jgi:Domain of Unknown Function (DUF1206)
MSGTSTQPSGGSDNAQRAKQAGREAGRQAVQAAESPWVKTLGQVGVAAIGVVHLLLAWICLQIAFGNSGGQTADNSGALREIAAQPFGKLLLAVMALGLFAYAVWQGIEATIGYGYETDHGKRTFKRISAGAKALIGVVLGLQAAKLAMGSGGKSSSQKQADWTAKLMGAPAGRFLVVLLGLAIIVFAGYLIYKGVEKKFLEQLEGGVSEAMTRFGQAGWIARGVVFGVLGVLVIVAGVKEQPQKARGLDAALKTLADQPFGSWILTLVALGLAAYGAFRVINARRTKAG